MGGSRPIDRVALVVCDSFGVGEAPDAAAYGDQGSNTLGHVAAAVGGLRAPALASLGLGAVTSMHGVSASAAAPGTAHGRLTERSAGKDTTTGHWEIAGVVLDRPFPLYPNGFPPEVIEPFERAIGLGILGNEPASGTEIIARLGEEHLRTGKPIVYTSGDSVFQIACHVQVVPLEELYEWCRIAREILHGDHNVGRVIARPFAGSPGAFQRLPDRRDFSVPPPSPTLLDLSVRSGVSVYSVGKIQDIFDGRGMTEARYSRSNDDGVDITLDYLRRGGPSLVVTNLVDFDSKYGHRNDPEGYAACIEAFDRRLPELVAEVLDDRQGRGLLFVTGDHGCETTDESTDHTRECVPVLVAGTGLDHPVDVGTRACFGDLGATVAQVLGVPAAELVGESFAEQLGMVPAADG
jgi:phosphopentomutase